VSQYFTDESWLADLLSPLECTQRKGIDELVEGIAGVVHEYKDGQTLCAEIIRHDFWYVSLHGRNRVMRPGYAPTAYE
jgi:hypothetical protein